MTFISDPTVFRILDPDRLWSRIRSQVFGYRWVCEDLYGCLIQGPLTYSKDTSQISIKNPIDYERAHTLIPPVT
jgi:hypothetical protein